MLTDDRKASQRRDENDDDGHHSIVPTERAAEFGMPSHHAEDIGNQCKDAANDAGNRDGFSPVPYRRATERLGGIFGCWIRQQRTGVAR